MAGCVGIGKGSEGERGCKWLHGAKGRSGQAAAQAFRFVVHHVAILLVEEFLEQTVIGLKLRLRSATEETAMLSELQRVAQHRANVGESTR